MAITYRIENPLHGRVSTTQAIADALRLAIMEGRLSAGESLRQEELARQFEVSRIPVREALRQLEIEGWIVFLPNKGASVTPLSIDEAREIYDILSALECTALRLAIPRHTLVTLARAEEALHTHIAGAEDVNRNSDFHLALYAPAQRPRLLNLIATQRQQVQRYLRLYFALPEYKHQTEREHTAILQACVQRDATRAVALLEQHLLQTGEMLVRYLEEQIPKGSASHEEEALTALQQKMAVSETQDTPFTLKAITKQEPIHD
ncbi:MAG: GntR family transcriptional regulator [Terriglobales bacterium]